MLKKGLDQGDSKKFWNYLKAQRQDSQGVAPLKEGNQLLADALSKDNALGAQFSSVFTEDTPDTAYIETDIWKEGPSYPPIHDLTKTTEGVQKLLNGLNPGKAGGPDEMSARMMKGVSEEIAPILASIFTQSLATGELPSD